MSIMGNGVGITSENQNIEFSRLEKICKSGYFYQNHEEYLNALTITIQMNKLDCLELLILSGNCKSILPVHLAAKLGKLEPMELILSAGFPGNAIDKQGRTPLHLATFASSTEANLVISLLCLSFPQSIHRYDHDGYKPIHLAIVNDNVLAIESLLQNGASASDVTQSGKSPIQLAKMLKSISAIGCLSKHQDNSTKKEIRGYTEKKSSRKTVKNDAVSTERIMQVWERFFDNAFKNAGVPMDDYSYDDFKSENKDDYSRRYASNSSSLAPSKEKANKKKDKKDLYLSTEDKNFEKKNSSSSIQYVPPREDWFDWVVCYDEEVENSQNAYYVINKYTKEKRWLDDHWRILQRLRDYPFLFEFDTTISTWPFPTSVWELSASGWLSYYDYYDNICWWMNIATNVFEYYLPLGFGNDFDLLAELNIFPSAEHPGWMEADQSCATAWIVVIYEDEYQSNNQYYFNTVTSQTGWDEPNHWNEMIASWNGWIPCAMEYNIDEIFWFNPVTNEASWG